MGTGSDIAKRLTLPSGGVSSLNALTGPLVLTSTGGTVAITLVGSNINLEASGSSVPGGALTSIQFNNSGAFGGFGTWNGTTFDVGSGANLKTQSLIVSALTPTRVPFATTGGAFTDNGSFLFNGTGGLTLGLIGTGSGVLAMKGTTSGTVSITAAAAAGTYNFNLPITAGTAGQPLLSQGGGAGTAMTFGTLGVTGGGTGQSGTLNMNGVIYGISTSAMASTLGGSSNTVLHGNGSSAPSFSIVLPQDISGLSSPGVGSIIVSGASGTTFSTVAAVATGSILVSNGTGVSPVYSTTLPSSIKGGIPVLSTTTAIDGKTIANTSLYTVPAGKTAVITGAAVRCSAATAITIGPSAGVGNVAGTNNIFASAAITALQTTTDVFGFSLVGMSKVTAAAGQIFLNLGTAATGTSQTLAVDLYGYLV